MRVTGFLAGVRLRGACFAALGALGLAPGALAGDDENTITAFEPRGLVDERCFAPPSLTADEVVDVPIHHGPYQPMTLHVETFLPHVVGDAPEGCPDTATHRSPSILIHSPYAGLPDSIPGYNNYHRYLIDHFVSRGYAVAVSAVRGTGLSGGCFEFFGPNEGRDVVALADYLRERPWSNGRVGGFGVSYDGAVLNAGVTSDPPAALDAIAVVAARSGVYDRRFFDGVNRFVFDGDALVYVAASLASGNPTQPESYFHRPGCQPESVESVLDRSGDMTPYYEAREFRTGVRRIQAAVLHIQGLTDPTVSPMNLVDWFDEIPTFHSSILGQWDHTEPDLAGDWRRLDYFPMLDAWFDHFLLDLPTGVGSWPRMQVQDEARMWRAVPSFAEMADEWTEWRLGVGTAPRQALPTDDPPAHPLGEAGPEGSVLTFDEFGVTADRELLWETAPLEESLHVSGQAALDLTVTLNRDDAHFAIRIEEVLPNGETTVGNARGYLSVRHRDSLAAPTPAPVGVPVTYEIHTYPFDMTFAAGSRIRLLLHGFDELGGDPSGSGYTATVHVDGSSILRLPIVTRYDCLRVLSRTPPASAPPGCEAVLEPLP